MPRNKDLKRLVRARMTKTGEAYTTARAQIVKKSRATPRATDPADLTSTPSTQAAAPAPVDFAALAGIKDEVIKEKTGCTWERWVYALDRRGADKLTHREIAELVHEKYKVGDWWAQTVTVGYERIKGLRAIGQRRDGSYEANKSRTYDVPVTTLFDAWHDASTRRRWLDGATVKVRTATSPKTIRLGWEDGTIVVVGFMAKGKSKSTVALSHTKLPDKATANRLKEYWAERLDALGEVLGPGSR
jgi:hypothetical protein